MIISCHPVETGKLFVQYMPFHITVAQENVHAAMDWCAQRGLANGYYPFSGKIDTDADYLQSNGIFGGHGQHFYFRLNSNEAFEFKLRFG